MSRIRFASAAAALLAATFLAEGPVQAQWAGGRGMVLVSPDGRILDTVPEYGSVRPVRDEFGRTLLVTPWNEVVAIEMTMREYRRQYGGFPEAPRPRRGYDAYPDTPIPDYDDEYASAPVFREEAYPPDMYPPAPEARIERRDLNPETASIPDAPNVIEAPRITEEPRLPAVDPAAAKLTKPQVTALQVYLDRAGFSPGVIDGRMGSNVMKALAAYKEATGETLDPADTQTVLDRLTAGEGLAFTTYEITPEDAAGPFVASIPTDYAEKAKLERMAFTSTLEMLAERFHMDEAYLKEINPDADFTVPGTIIKVVQTGRKKTGSVARIIADKGLKQVRGYDEAGKLVVAYPATIGSTDTPSPTGEVRIERIALNPGYTYNPKINFKQGDNDRVLQVPPGPNGPVGTVWIALSKPTYGIHGTPDPSKIGKTASHGCVRLTNWDAEELAKLVKPGVTVTFIE
jgi:Uncharacterized protein conserved in bacteria